MQAEDEQTKIIVQSTYMYMYVHKCNRVIDYCNEYMGVTATLIPTHDAFGLLCSVIGSVNSLAAEVHVYNSLNSLKFPGRFSC